ncbi:ATP-binding protein [Aquabacterium sp.]|uniref:ATP-binding protein n=1 Tax=Aquabacterium sp. TaxID=1872578 RepID=UPI002BCDFA12|nr:ATP-binding protein [Aquabacterium sp.]HSW04608.1 ATP-binding protein [Aquabacterium sp.]
MSIRIRLILLVLSVMLPALAAAVWVIATTLAEAREAQVPPVGWMAALLDGQSAVPQVVICTVLLIALALAGALWVSRRISGPIESLQAAARQLQQGQAVERRSTGIDECDMVLATLAEASETLRHARGDLELQVEHAVQRTREAEQRASRSQRIEALGRLTGGVAHDFNNLLGVVSNSAHLIQRRATGDALAAPLAAPLGAILRAVEVGHRLTQHLLRFAGRKPVRPQMLDLRQYLMSLNELMRTVLGSGIQFKARVAADTHAVTLDSAELELALINLALNARDAMPRGGEVQLQARNAAADELEGLPREASGDFVLITFGDSGSGIDEETARHVFEPFFTTKPVGKGSGLGLAQVRGFCVQAGGTARLASTPGLGTTVSLLLPAGQGQVEAAPARVAADGASLTGRQVLLVEDNEDLGAITEALLADFGCRVQRVSGADEALRAVAAVAFDAVLSDVVMPGVMDGLALAHELRRRQPQLPVLLISGYSSALGGAHDFEVLAKPCPPEAMVAALQRAMQPAAALPGR